VDSVYKYDVTSKSYDQLYRDEQFEKYRYILINKKLLPRGVVADIGCGTGLLIEFIKNNMIDYYDKYFCIEPSTGMLNILYSKNIIDHRIIVIQGYGEHLPLHDKIIDTIYLFTVWDNVKDKEKLLREIDRVLKPKGYAVISVVSKAKNPKPPDLDPKYVFLGCNIDCFYLYVKS